ncbi:MAG: hypothetical protein P8Y17_00625 [Patescibacteria group bacterium]|jgi:hypothetical protein
MSPAQRRKRLVKLRTKKNGKKSLKKFAIVFLVGLLAFLFISLQTKFWSSSDKMSLVMRKENGDVIISVFEPEQEKITNLIIPENTEVNVARQLGRWKLRSVWELGENEKLGGRLLAETFVKHFKLPVVAWADSPAVGFAEGDLGKVIRASLLPYKTNLGIGDKLKLGFFSFKIKNLKREDIDFSENNILKKTVLLDGEEGYILTNSLPNYILALFSNSEISNRSIRAAIIDGTGKAKVAEDVGEIIEVMGAKLANIKKGEVADIDCLVAGREKVVAEEVAEVLSCEKSKELPEGNFDLEIKIGTEFAKRF